MGFKPFPDVAEFAEFGDELHEHGTKSEQVVKLVLQRAGERAERVRR